MKSWYCAKSIESHGNIAPHVNIPIVVLQNLVLLKADSLSDAQERAASLGTKQAERLGRFVLFNGLQGAAKFEGLRSIQLIQSAEELIKSGTTISSSVFKPAEGVNEQEFVEQCRMLKVTYFGEPLSFLEHVPSPNYNSDSDDIETWLSANLIF